jgi:hypothetical protein
MAGSIGIITGVFVAKGGATCMARILGNLGTPITRASIASITYNVQDLNTLLSTGNGVLTPANVIFDSLQQNDPRWDKDSAVRSGKDGQWGYNFLNLFSRTLFPAFDVDNTTSPPTVKPHRYRIDVTFVPVSGENFLAMFEGIALPTWP